MKYTKPIVDFVTVIVADAVLRDGNLSHLKYLERYCRLEGCNYEDLIEDMGVLVESLRAYRRKKSKVSLKLAKHQADLCGLTEKFVEDLSVLPATRTSQPLESSYLTSLFSYMGGRGGDIFNEMPGGHLLKRK